MTGPKKSNSNTYFVDRRLLLGGSMSMAILAVLGCTRESARKKILFVCQFGTVKSVAARELLYQHASKSGVPIEVISRGITPEHHLSEALKKKLLADELELQRHPVKHLDLETLQSADVVILFDPLPSGFSRDDARDWSDTPSMNNDYEAARAFLDPRIDSLLREVSN